MIAVKNYETSWRSPHFKRGAKIRRSTLGVQISLIIKLFFMKGALIWRKREIRNMKFSSQNHMWYMNNGFTRWKNFLTLYKRFGTWIEMLKLQTIHLSYPRKVSPTFSPRSTDQRRSHTHYTSFFRNKKQLS